MAVARTWAAEWRKRSMSVIWARCSGVLRSPSSAMNATRFLDFARNDKRKLRGSSRDWHSTPMDLTDAEQITQSGFRDPRRSHRRIRDSLFGLQQERL